MKPDSEPALKAFAGPVRWLGIGFLAMGVLVLASAVWSQIETFDPEELLGLVVPLLFVAAGSGMMRLSRRMRDDPAFEIGHLGGVIFTAVGAAMAAGGVAMTFQDPGGIAMIVFGLVFLGAGWMARKLFVTPEGMKKVAVQSSSADVAHGLGRQTSVSSTTYIDVREDATNEEIAEAREQWQADRIADRDDWARGEIEQEANRHGNIFVYAAAGFLALAIALILIGVFVNSFFYFIGGFVGFVALLLIVHTVLRSIRVRKFDVARFHMDSVPTAPGETVSGQIRTEAARNALEDGQFTVTLSCKQVVRYESNDRTQYRTTVLWSDSQAVAATGETALTVPVSFTTPDDQPSATVGHNRSTAIHWELEAKATAPGVDYLAVFTLPVFSQN